MDVMGVEEEEDQETIINFIQHKQPKNGNQTLFDYCNIF